MKGDFILYEEYKLEELENLSDDELRDRIVAINKEQLSKIGNISLYDVLIRGIKFIDNSEENMKIIDRIVSKDEKEQLFKCYNDIFKYIRNIDHIFITGDFHKDREIEKLRSVREQLFSLFLSLRPYLIENSYISEMADYLIIRDKAEDMYKNIEFEDIDYYSFYTVLNDYIIKNSTDYYSLNSFISDTIKILPFRLTKEKFFDILKEALINNLRYESMNMVENYIKYYKSLFDGTLDAEYGIKYDGFFRNTQILKRVDLIKCSIEKLNEVLNKSQKNIENISAVSGFIKKLGITCNKLIALVMTKEAIIDDIDRKVLIGWTNFIAGDTSISSDKFIKFLDSNITDMKKCMEDRNTLLKNLTQESIKRGKIVDEIVKENLLYTQNTLAYFDDSIFEDEKILFDDSEKVEEDYLEDVLDNFIQFISIDITSMNNFERKIRMRNILHFIEYPFTSPDDFLDYVQYSLDSKVTPKEDILLAMDHFNYLMTEDQEE